MCRRPVLLMLQVLLLACSSLPARAEPPARVLLLGSWHMANPGQDMVNVQAADVLTPQRQQQLAAVVQALARYRPNQVAVEMSLADAAAAYPRWLSGALPPSRSEAVQIGFRLAQQLGLERVHGIDVPGEFPMPAVMAYAAETGRMGEIQAAMAGVMARAQAISALAATDIPAALRRVNDRATLAGDHALYMGLLRFGAGERQPGVALMSAWMQRNLGMCARLVQQLRPGDRALLLVGTAHVEPIRGCLLAMPGVEVEDAIDHLP